MARDAVELLSVGALAMMKWFGRKVAKPSIESLSFGSAGWKYNGEAEPGAARRWETAEHDVVALHFFEVGPDLPVARTVEELTAGYAAKFAASVGGKVVECAVESFAGCGAVRLLLKAPQNPSGMMYIGAVTVPFRGFHYFVTVRCLEQGTTGMREAILFEKRCQAGETPNFGRPEEPFPGWNPDEAEHDKAFPDHPVSRLRRQLKGIAESAVLDERVRGLPGFPLPAS